MVIMMPMAVQAKVMQIGNSLGVILPAELIRSEKIHKGETVQVTVFKQRKIDLKKFMGITHGASSFEREHEESD